MSNMMITRGRRSRAIASMRLNANLVATIMSAPPEMQEWAIEEMRQMVACYQPCHPATPTRDGLRAELEGGGV